MLLKAETSILPYSPQILHVSGVLFFRDEYDIELSFDEAFHEINNNKLFGLSFQLIKRFVPNDDSFILQQLSKYNNKLITR